MTDDSMNPVSDDSRLSRRDKQAQETRTRLVETALDLFAHHGLEATTTKDIAMRAGVAQGLLYHYFKSKEELLWAILDSHMFLPHLQQVLVDAEARPVAETLKTVIRAFDAYLHENETLLRLVMQVIQTNSKMADIWAASLQREQSALLSFLEDRVASGELRPHDTTVTARLLMYTTVMMNLSGTLFRGEHEAYLDKMVDAVTHGVLSRE